MFKGVTSHHDSPRVASYDDACKALERAGRTPTGKVRHPKPDGFPLGGHSKSVTWVRENEDGGIAFMLYSTDVVTWLPDNSILIDNYGTTTTSGFAGRFLPPGISLNYTRERQGTTLGNKCIQYRTSIPDDGYWGGPRLCQGALVHFLPKGDVWLPDEATCSSMRFPVLDRKAAREISKHYHLKMFEDWLAVAPRHIEIEHIEQDTCKAAEALEAKDFRTAAAYLPLIKDTSAFGNELTPLPITTKRWDSAITMGSLQLLKLALWDRQAAFDVVERTTISTTEFDRRMVRVRQLARSGVHDNWGPDE